MAGGDASLQGERSWARSAVSVLVGAVVWGASMAGTAAITLIAFQARAFQGEVPGLLGLYFTGGLLAYPFAWIAVAWLRRRLSGPFLFAAALLLLAGLTLTATAGVIALEYREYYAQWHAPAFSRIWFWQQAFTAAGSTFQYAVIGTRLYWPLGVVFLAATSWWLSRKAS